jgi:glucan biosynthesis protein C
MAATSIKEAPVTVAVSAAGRLYFLDNLRAVVIALVVVLHGCITYMVNAPTWWYVLDPHNSLAFTLVVLAIDVPIMPIMFFIAGYFALPSLQKRGSRQFLKDKCLRVGLPWVLGVIFLAPLTTYMIYVSRHVPMGYLQFWASDFWTKLYEQSVYWFLGILLLLFAGLAWMFEISPRLRAAAPRPSPRAGRALLVFGVLVTAAFVAVNQAYPIDAWSSNYVFVYQPVRVPLYVGYFILGIYAQQRGWFRAGGFNPKIRPWLGAALLSGLYYLASRMFAPATPLLGVVTAVLFNAFCLTSLLAGVALCQRYLNGAGRFWHSQAASAYGIYYAHPLILYPLAYALAAVSLPLAVKALVLIVPTLLLAWGVSALVLRRLPILNHMF